MCVWNFDENFVLLFSLTPLLLHGLLIHLQFKTHLFFMEKFEDAALFLPLGLPSTLNRHANRGTFQKRRNIKKPSLRFSAD